MNLDREIKVGIKMERRLIYLGFEEQNLNVHGLLPHKIERRYFVHKCGLQVRVNNKERTLTLLSSNGTVMETRPMFLSSYLKALTTL